MQRRREKYIQRISRLDSSAQDQPEKYTYVLHGYLSAQAYRNKTGDVGEQKSEFQQANHNGNFIPIKKAIRYASVRATVDLNPSPDNKLISLSIPTQRKKIAGASSKPWSTDEDTVAEDSESMNLDKFEVLSRQTTWKFMQWVSQRSLNKRSVTQQDSSKLSCKDINMVVDPEELSGSVINGLGKLDLNSAVQPKDDSSELDIKDEQSDLSIKWIKLNSQKGLQTKFLSCQSLKGTKQSATTTKQMHMKLAEFNGKSLGH